MSFRLRKMESTAICTVIGGKMNTTRYTQRQFAGLRTDTAPIKPAGDRLKGFYLQRNAAPGLVKEVYSGDVDIPEVSRSNAWITQPVYYAITRDKTRRKIK